MLDLFAKAIAENNQKDMLRWGPHVRTFRDELMDKMVKQFRWLEDQLPARPIEEVGTEDNRDRHPRYEERFNEFSKNHAEYMRACDLLDKASTCL